MAPAREVGGDFYDFFTVDERHLAIVIADVSGKGVPAALFMVIGKTLIKDHTRPGSSLEDVFSQVNDLFCDSNQEGMFITAFEGVLDLVSREFCFVNAGLENMKYQCGSIWLEPGDKIFERTIKMPGQIRTSAKAVIIHNGKLLAIKLNDGKEEWYILPGGGQDGEEMLTQTVEREVREEAGIEVQCKDLLFVIEGVHGESFHRIDLVFLCDYLGEAQHATLHGDTNQIGFDWLDLSVLNRLPLFPSKLRRPIMNFYEGKEYIKYLGNEEVGDPEHIE